MAKECQICKKGGAMVWRLKKLRGKYNPTSKKRKYPNLQWVKIPLDVRKPAYRKFAGKKILACTKCIKTLTKKN